MLRIPIKFGLPLLILGFGLIAGLFSYHYHARQAVESIDTRVVAYLRRELSRVQHNLEYLLTSEHGNRVQEQIGPLAENPNLEFVFVVNDQGTVLASLRRWHRGHAVGEVLQRLPETVRTFVRRTVNSAATDRATPVQLNESGTRAWGVYPLTLAARGDALRPTRQGLLIAGYDLTAERAAARQAVARQAITVGAALAAIALLVGLLLHFFITRRLQRILDCVRRFAAGDLGARINLRGYDELAQVANALDRAAATVAATRKRLEESEARLSEAQRIAHLGSWEAEAGEDEFVCSVETMRLFGMDYGQRRISLADYLLAVHPDDRDRIQRLINAPTLPDACMASAEYRIVRPDGQVRWLHSRWRVEYCATGQPKRYTGTNLDITDQKLTEQALAEARERALVTLHSIGDAVITTDAEGRIAYLNPVAEQLTGWPTAEARGQPLEEIFRIAREESGARAPSPVETCLREGRTVGLSDHTVLVSRDGQHIAIEDSAAPIRDSEGNVLGVVLVFHDVTEKRRLTQELEWQACHDQLTGLHNRFEFERRLADALDDAKTGNADHALIYFDLDQFKIVNDTCGHTAGDELLRQIPVVLQHSIRANDVFARLGGDEFGVIVFDCDGPAAISLAEDLLQDIRDFRFVWDERTFEIGASFGVVSINSASLAESALMTAADLACYMAKDHGRGRVHFYQPDDEALAQRHSELQQVSSISRALEDDRFVLYTQSIVPCAGGKYRLHELLVRMVDETGRLVPPGAFIPAAERYDLMPALDRWIIRSFFTRYADRLREAAERGDAVYTINISGASLSDEGFRSFLIRQIEEARIPTRALCFEITETAAVANLTQTRDLILELKERGCRFALDDFGSGVSSFAYLKNLPVDYLKIDGGFVRDMCDDSIDAALVASINHIGHELGMLTIAEFVENGDILAALRELGVDFAQGFGVARPEPLSEMEQISEPAGLVVTTP